MVTPVCGISKPRRAAALVAVEPAMLCDAEFSRAQRAELRRFRQAVVVLALSTDEFPLLSPLALGALDMPILLVSGRDTPAIHAEVFRNVCAAMPQARHAVLQPFMRRCRPS